MDKKLSQRVDELINQYKKDHRGETPGYIILSPDDGDALTEEVRQSTQQPKSNMITTYKESKIVTNLSVHDGKFYVSHELPETGS